MVLNKQKTDGKLGQEVKIYLEQIGIQTPMLKTINNTEEEKINIIRRKFKIIMETLGLDLSDDSLTDTPKRVAKMFVNEIFWGLDPNNFPKCTTVENKIQQDEMITVSRINVQSFCEHHFVNIDGEAYVSYIPNKKILGLSKFNRVVEYFSRRPQIQERLGRQIFYALKHILDTDNIAVLIKAKHLCVKSRGVEDENSYTITSKVGGIFKTNNSTKNEFLQLINMQN